MDDLHIDHDGTNYVAEAYSDKWVAGSDWFTLTITPTSYGFPDTDGKVKTVPDDMTPKQALMDFAAIRHRFEVAASVHESYVTPETRTIAALSTLIGEAREAADALERTGMYAADAEILRHEIRTAAYTVEKVTGWRR